MKRNVRLILSTTTLKGLFWLVFLTIIVLSLVPVGHPEFSPNDKINHLLGWGALGLLGWLGWPGRWRVLLLLWCASIAIEGAQGLTAYRFFSWADALANGVGLLIGLVIANIWHRLRTVPVLNRLKKE